MTRFLVQVGQKSPPLHNGSPQGKKEILMSSLQEGYEWGKEPGNSVMKSTTTWIVASPKSPVSAWTFLC